MTSHALFLCFLSHLPPPPPRQKSCPELPTRSKAASCAVPFWPLLTLHIPAHFQVLLDAFPASGFSASLLRSLQIYLGRILSNIAPNSISPLPRQQMQVLEPLLKTTGQTFTLHYTFINTAHSSCNRSETVSVYPCHNFSPPHCLPMYFSN